MGAYPVRHFRFPTLLASGELGRSQTIMRPPLITAGLGMSPFGVGHKKITSQLVNLEVLQWCEAGIGHLPRTLAGSPAQILATPGA